MSFKKPYGKRTRTPLIIDSASMTQQQFKRECDINHLLRKYQKTGMLEHVNKFQGDYSDLCDVPDYHTAMNKIVSANNAFNMLPSSVRKRFSNDPAQFLQFVSDESNSDEMIELGLKKATPPPEPSPTDVPPVADAPNPEPVE